MFFWEKLTVLMTHLKHEGQFTCHVPVFITVSMVVPVHIFFLEWFGARACLWVTNTWFGCRATNSHLLLNHETHNTLLYSIWAKTQLICTFISNSRLNHPKINGARTCGAPGTFSLFGIASTLCRPLVVFLYLGVFIQSPTFPFFLNLGYKMPDCKGYDLRLEINQTDVGSFFFFGSALRMDNEESVSLEDW